MRYPLVIEKAESSYSAYVPDLPGCVATRATIAEVAAEIREAIAFHVEGLREDGLPIPAAAAKSNTSRPTLNRLLVAVRSGRQTWGLHSSARGELD